MPKIPTTKLNPEKVIQIRKRHKEGDTPASLGRAFGVSANTIKALLNRRTWKYVA